MFNAAVGEWVLSRATSRQRAAAIVGDLLERDKGGWWFWSALARIVVALTWRRPVGFLAALCVSNLTIDVLARHIWRAYRLLHLKQQMPLTLQVFCFVCLIFWIMAVYAGIRFGWRDRATQLACICSALAAVTLSMWSRPEILLTGMAATAGIMGISLVFGRFRRAAPVLIVGQLAGLVGFFFGVILLSSLWRWLAAPATGDRGIDSHWLLWVAANVDLVMVRCTTAACSIMHRRLLERRLPDPAA